MKINYLLRIATVGVLWLCFGAGCQKDPPKPQSCNDGTCCMRDTGKYEYVTTIANEPAAIDGRSFWTVSRFPTTATQQECKSSIMGICDLSSASITGLPESVAFVQQGDKMVGVPTYRYRIWGKLYRWNIPTLLCAPILIVSLDRIEEVK